jgi:hypothetical protein
MKEERSTWQRVAFQIKLRRLLSYAGQRSVITTGPADTGIPFLSRMGKLKIF